MSKFAFDVPGRATNGSYTFTLKSEGCRDLVLMVDVGSRIAIDLQPVNQPLTDRSVPLKLVIANESGEKITGRLSIKVPGDNPPAGGRVAHRPGRPAIGDHRSAPSKA